MARPLCIDLFCGLGGWAEGFLAEGYDVIGFDIERHDYGAGGYPGQLVLQDVLTLHGSQFHNAAVIVASPPCQAYSYMSMPWRRAKREIAWQKWQRTSVWWTDRSLNERFESCFRIAGEADVPLVVENVKGAQPWVGRARWHYGSYYLWGDVPALMPSSLPLAKVAGLNWSGSDKPGYVAKAFNDTAVSRLYADRDSNGTKQHGSGPIWWRTGNGAMPSKSLRRKSSSAQIAKIPFPLAQHIARVFKPQNP